MNVQILTPEELVFKGEVTSLTLPGINGSFQLLDNHAPIVSTLREGKLIFISNDNESFESKKVIKSTDGLSKECIIKGGVLEMNSNKVVILLD
ncbi:MAG: F0F1 ATP synthase subunit epsilon [Flavobacteriales bacterium]|nr:F0F1 ATP synthase subunit epsilon [Flavobacteriales bacterium]